MKNIEQKRVPNRPYEVLVHIIRNCVQHCNITRNHESNENRNELVKDTTGCVVSEILRLGVWREQSTQRPGQMNDELEEESIYIQVNSDRIEEQWLFFPLWDRNRENFKVS